MNSENDALFKKIYDSLIDRGRTRGLDKTKLVGYYEKHHIVPKCLGGNDEDDNLVLLTYREHVICHVLLHRLNSENLDLLRAANFMLSVDRVDPITGETIVIKLKSSRVAEEIKLKAVEANRGINSPSYGRKLTQEHKDILSRVNSHPKSPTTIEKMRKAQLGKTATEETKQKLSKAHKGLKIHSEEHKKELSKNWKLNNPRVGVDMTGENNPSSKKIIGPDGTVYKSIKYCASCNNVSYDTMRRWVNSVPSKGYKISK